MANSHPSPSSSSKTKAVRLPSLHSKIDNADIKTEDGRILSLAHIADAKRALADEPDGVFSKQFLAAKGLGHLPRRVLKADGKYFAIYKGVKHETVKEKFGKALGKGSFGKVVLAQELDSGELYALKVQHISRAEEAKREHAVLSELKLTAGGILTKKREGRPVDKEYFLMKLAPGIELAQYMKLIGQGRYRVPEHRLISIATQMVAEVIATNQQGYLHRDIKPGNFVYDPVQNKIKLVDYGLAAKIGADKKIESYDFVGTDLYTAPEFLSSRGHGFTYDEKTEVFALGRSIHELLALGPLEGRRMMDSSPYRSTSYYDKTDTGYIESLANFVNRMTAVNPIERPTLAEAHTFLLNAKQKYVSSYTVTVGVLNLAVYEQANLEQRKQLIAGLRMMNEVFLIDTRPTSSIPLSLLQELQQNDIILPNKIIPISDVALSGREIAKALYSYSQERGFNIQSAIYLDLDKNESLEKSMHKGNVGYIPLYSISRYKAEISRSSYFSPAGFNGLYFRLNDITKNASAEIQHLTQEMINELKTLQKAGNLWQRDVQRRFYEYEKQWLALTGQPCPLEIGGNLGQVVSPRKIAAGSFAVEVKSPHAPLEINSPHAPLDIKPPLAQTGMKSPLAQDETRSPNAAHLEIKSPAAQDEIDQIMMKIHNEFGLIYAYIDNKIKTIEGSVAVVPYLALKQQLLARKAEVEALWHEKKLTLDMAKNIFKEISELEDPKKLAEVSSPKTPSELTSPKPPAPSEIASPGKKIPLGDFNSDPVSVSHSPHSRNNPLRRK